MQWRTVSIGFALVLVALFGGAAWRYVHSSARPAAGVSAGAATTTPVVSSTTPAVGTNGTVPAATPAAFPLNPADTLASWSFTGTDTGNAALIAQTNADRDNLTALLGKGTYDDYDLYIGLGNDDVLLGDGKGAYQNFNRAVAIHPKKGLAFANLGSLFNELGAYHTAADAYAKAVAVEPAQLMYHLDRLNFLTIRFPTDSQMVSAAFVDASKQFGDTAPVLTIEAQWLTGLGRYADAIKAWEAAKTLSPADRQSAIDAEIARLTAKENQ